VSERLSSRKKGRKKYVLRAEGIIKKFQEAKKIYASSGRRESKKVIRRKRRKVSNGVRKGRMRRAPFRSSQVGAGVGVGGRAWMDGPRGEEKESERG